MHANRNSGIKLSLIFSHIVYFHSLVLDRVLEGKERNSMKENNKNQKMVIFILGEGQIEYKRKLPSEGNEEITENRRIVLEHWMESGRF